MTSTIYIFRKDLRITDNDLFNLALSNDDRSGVVPVFIWGGKLWNEVGDNPSASLSSLSDGVYNLVSLLRDIGLDILLLQCDPIDFVKGLTELVELTVYTQSSVFISDTIIEMNKYLSSKIVTECPERQLIDKSLRRSSRKSVKKRNKGWHKEILPVNRNSVSQITTILKKQSERIHIIDSYRKTIAGLFIYFPHQPTTSKQLANIIESISWYERYYTRDYSDDEPKDGYKPKDGDKPKDDDSRSESISDREDSDVSMMNINISPIINVGLITPEAFITTISRSIQRNSVDIIDSRFRIRAVNTEIFKILFKKSERKNAIINSLYDPPPELSSKDEQLLTSLMLARTGFPLVDAGIIEMTKYGRLRNTVRLVVASFLVHDLGLDWRIGNRIFAKYLADYDPIQSFINWMRVICSRYKYHGLDEIINLIGNVFDISVGIISEPCKHSYNLSGIPSPWLRLRMMDDGLAYISEFLLSSFRKRRLSSQVLMRWNVLHKNYTAKQLYALGYVRPIVNHKKIVKAIFTSQ